MTPVGIKALQLAKVKGKKISVKRSLLFAWRFKMRYPSAYLDWYIHVPQLKYDMRSSGITGFKYNVNLGEADLSVNYAHGNPETARLLAKRYHVKPENVFISSEGASGQNARVIRYLAERNPEKTEAIVEYPTYEPLLRQVQDHFRIVRRLERNEKDRYRLDVDALRMLVSEKTGLLVLTNPHAPSGAIANVGKLKEILAVAQEHDFFVFCDEIYAEFDRKSIPTVFSIDPECGIVTTSFTKAYGLGGLKLGIALAKKELVDEFYMDVLNTVGNSPNVVQLLSSEILAHGTADMEKHKLKWMPLKNETEKWFNENKLEYFANKLSVTYWVKLPTKDTYKWINEHAIPRYSLAPVPGAFFLFKNDYKLKKSNMARVGIGNINPDRLDLAEAFETFGRAMKSYKGA